MSWVISGKPAFLPPRVPLRGGFPAPTPHCHIQKFARATRGEPRCRVGARRGQRCPGLSGLRPGGGGLRDLRPLLPTSPSPPPPKKNQPRPTREGAHTPAGVKGDFLHQPQGVPVCLWAEVPCSLRRSDGALTGRHTDVGPAVTPLQREQFRKELEGQKGPSQWPPGLPSEMGLATSRLPAAQIPAESSPLCL